MIVKYRIKCTTCDSTTVTDSGKIPSGWARDHGGDIHCLKCWKIARLLVKAYGKEEE